jgi:hypothetical protein
MVNWLYLIDMTDSPMPGTDDGQDGGGSGGSDGGSK